MNDVKTLKILLIVVIIVGGALAGYATYQRNIVVTERQNFVLALQQATTKDQAVKIVSDYAGSNAGELALSADAGFFGFLKRLFGGHSGDQSSSATLGSSAGSSNAELLLTGESSSEQPIGQGEDGLK